MRAVIIVGLIAVGVTVGGGCHCGRIRNFNNGDCDAVDVLTGIGLFLLQPLAAIRLVVLSLE